MAGRTYQGASGRNYAYGIFSTADLNNLPLQAGNYIFATADGTAIYIEAANSVRKSVVESDFWDHAQDVHGASFLLVHFDHESGEPQRHAEKMDLIDAHHPPMNQRANSPIR
jgi:hypothetical protein